MLTDKKKTILEIIVKFREGGTLEEKDGKFVAEHLDLDDFYKVIDSIKGLEARQSFPKVTKRLKELNFKAKKREGLVIPSLDLFIRLRLTEAVEIDSLINILNKDPEIEYACLASIPGPPPQAPDFTDQQIYIDEAPEGVDARYSWRSSWGTGTGVTICDCEYGFNENHIDLLGKVHVIYNEDNNLSEFYEHGTKALGVLTAIHNNNEGITGISYDANILFASESPESSPNRTECIDEAITRLNPGDVLLLEMQSNYLPVERDTDIHRAISDAVDLGIVVVCAAGNGRTNLTNEMNANNERIWDPDNPNDSGAIIVGAGTSILYIPEFPYLPTPPPCSILTDSSSIFAGPESNYGTRVDCQGWGDSVLTSGPPSGNNDSVYYDDGGDPNRSFTRWYGRTSSAVAIVAGVIACLQGYAKLAFGEPLSPITIRNLLRDDNNGTPQADGILGYNARNYHIGPMPDLRKLLTALEISPDVYMRDNLADTGIEPSTGPILYRSPDIIPRNNEVNDPLAEFGPASWEDEYLGENIRHGQNNFIYIRLNNRGNAPDSVNVSLYWAESSTFIHPSDWTQINTILVNDIQPGELRVEGPIVWQNNHIPHPGHYCLIAVVNSVRDPLEIPDEFTSVEEYLDFIRNNNNICYRNIDIVELAPGGQPSRYMFFMRGIPKKTARFRLEVRHQLPEDTNIEIEVAKNIPRFINIYINNKKPDTLKTLFKLKERHPLILDKIILGRDEKLPIKIMVKLPNKVRPGVYAIYADQYLDKIHLGRVNYMIRILKNSEG